MGMFLTTVVLDCCNIPTTRYEQIRTRYLVSYMLGRDRVGPKSFQNGSAGRGTVQQYRELGLSWQDGADNERTEGIIYFIRGRCTVFYIFLCSTEGVRTYITFFSPRNFFSMSLFLLLLIVTFTSELSSQWAIPSSIRGIFYVITLLPPGTCLHFFSRIGFSILTARRFLSDGADSRSRAFR